MQLVGYLRVSTDRQAEKGQGLDVQRKAIAAWAKTSGHRIVHWARDEGVSGTSDAADRPGLSEGLNLICDRQPNGHQKAKGLVAHRLDRLARTLTVQEAVLSRVWHCDGHVFTVDQGEIPQDDPDDSMRTFVRQVMGAVAQLEKGMISQRLRQGRAMKAEKGGFAYGSPRFGYRSLDGVLVPDVEEQATLARIMELRAQLGPEGKPVSLRVIADTLTNEGRRTKQGRTWHPESLRLILKANEQERASI